MLESPRESVDKKGPGSVVYWSHADEKAASEGGFLHCEDLWCRGSLLIHLGQPASELSEGFIKVFCCSPCEFEILADVCKGTFFGFSHALPVIRGLE